MNYFLQCQGFGYLLLLIETHLGLFELSFNQQLLLSTRFTQFQEIKTLSNVDLLKKIQLAYPLWEIEFNSCLDFSQTIPTFITKLARQIKNHLMGDLQNFDLSCIDKSNWSLFKSSIIDNLCLVKPGSTISYKRLALNSGFPLAYRACGSVMAKNNYVLLIPCHRVIKYNCDLGNYSAYAGVITKQKLLNIENIKL